MRSERERKNKRPHSSKRTIQQELPHGNSRLAAAGAAPDPPLPLLCQRLLPPMHLQQQQLRGRVVCFGIVRCGDGEGGCAARRGGDGGERGEGGAGEDGAAELGGLVVAAAAPSAPPSPSSCSSSSCSSSSCSSSPSSSSSSSSSSSGAVRSSSSSSSRVEGIFAGLAVAQQQVVLNYLCCDVVMW